MSWVEFEGVVGGNQVQGHGYSCWNGVEPQFVQWLASFGFESHVLAWLHEMRYEAIVVREVRVELQQRAMSEKRPPRVEVN